MKSTRLKVFIVPFLIFAAAVSVHAQITWASVGNITDTSDISTTGSFIDAVTLHSTSSAASVTIGDSTFYNLNSLFTATGGSPSQTATSGAITVTDDNTANLQTPPTSDTAYQQAIGYAGYTNNSEPGTISFSGLTANQTYQVEVWSYYSDNRFDPVLSGTTATELDCSVGQWAVGQFTASSSTFTFDYAIATHSDSAGALINAVALREVPEPSTWLMMGIGAVLIAWRLRRATLA